MLEGIAGWFILSMITTVIGIKVTIINNPFKLALSISAFTATTVSLEVNETNITVKRVWNSFLIATCDSSQKAQTIHPAKALIQSQTINRIKHLLFFTLGKFVLILKCI